MFEESSVSQVMEAVTLLANGLNTVAKSLTNIYDRLSSIDNRIIDLEIRLHNYIDNRSFNKPLC